MTTIILKTYHIIIIQKCVIQTCQVRRSWWSGVLFCSSNYFVSWL